MKNRRQQLGKPVRIPKTLASLPDDFERILSNAAKDGHAFAPSVVELDNQALRRSLRLKMEEYKKLAKRDPVVFRAIAALFYHVLSVIILANPNEEKWLVKKGLSYSVDAQNNMVLVMLGLSDEDRSRFLKIWEAAGINFNDWFMYYQGSMAVARFIYAALNCGVSIRLAQNEHDIFRKIDLFCESPLHGTPTLCVQVKSNVFSDGASLHLLKSRPKSDGISPEEYKLREGVWRGVQDFNYSYKRNWVPLLARIGVRGEAISHIQGKNIQIDVETFFANLVALYDEDGDPSSVLKSA